MPYISRTLRQESSAIDGSFNRWLMDNNYTPATVDTIGYITDARAKRMQVGDLVTYRQWTTAPNVTGRGVQTGELGALIAISTMVVLAIATNGSANLSDSTVITMTNTR